MKRERLAALCAGGLALAASLSTLRPPGEVCDEAAAGEARRCFDVEAFARLPVLEGGRVKPADSVARNALLMLRSKQTVRDGGRAVRASTWLLDLLFRPQVADRLPSFYVDDPEVLSLAGHTVQEGRYFAFSALAPRLEAIQQQAQAAHEVEAKARTRFQSAVVNLFDRLYLYYRLRSTAELVGGPTLEGEVAARAAPEAAERQEAMAQLGFFRPLPPLGPTGDGWLTVGEALKAGRSGTLHASLPPLARVGEAWAGRDPVAFSAAVAELSRSIAASRPEALSRARSEVLFNRAEPFYAGMVIYVLALLSLFVSWLVWPRLLQPAAFGLLVSGAIVHTLGLAARVLLQGRPPVTNLYSSAVFVGWVAVLVGIALERMHRRGFGTAVAAAAGFASLIVAHHLQGDGDTMEMMRAVLDSNFWLATHVVTITIGYSGTFLAGALAIGYTFRKHLAPRLEPATSKALLSMTYGVVCFALLFSFVGTVLGGIWADQSWGRFWGWDPKENGALLIVLWNAIILHARWGGYARERGIMAMAIFGNVITSLSWFGVNMLGIGLHSYGFMDRAFWALSAFIASQLVLMALCLLPRRFWSAATLAAGGPAGAGNQRAGT